MRMEGKVRGKCRSQQSRAVKSSCMTPINIKSCKDHASGRQCIISIMNVAELLLQWLQPVQRCFKLGAHGLWAQQRCGKSSGNDTSGAFIMLLAVLGLVTHGGLHHDGTVKDHGVASTDAPVAAPASALRIAASSEADLRCSFRSSPMPVCDKVANRVIAADHTLLQHTASMLCGKSDKEW